MDEMITFSVAMLQAVTDFLIAPPMFYLFSLVCFAAIVKIVRDLIKFT